MTNEHPIYHLGSAKEERQRLVDQVKLYGDTQLFSFTREETVCEIGCGSGGNLWAADQAGHFIGVDISQEHIAAARERALLLGLSNVTFYCDDGAKTCVESESCDAAFCRCVLIHQADPRKILSEICRITRQGGRCIASEPYVSAYAYGPDKTNLMKVFEARNTYVYAPGKGSLRIAPELYSLFSEAGLKEINIRSHPIFVTGREEARCSYLLNNATGLIRPVADELIAEKIISREEWQQAQTEATMVNPHTFVYQEMMIVEGTKAQSLS